jgi:hypothetical protein
MSVCLPNINNTTGKYNRKVCALGLTKVLTEWTPMFEEPYLQIWSPLLEAIIVLLEEEEPDKDMQSQDLSQIYIDFEDNTNFASNYSKLFYASKPNDETYKNIEPRQVLANAVSQLLSRDPEKIRSLIQKLNPRYYEHLRHYMTLVGITLS